MWGRSLGRSKRSAEPPMARARNLKPGFFSNEQLAECDPLARLLFQGLWLHADRDGRLEDRPKRFKATILPYDKCDIDALLKQLVDRQFIIRYINSGYCYIEITTFSLHQRPYTKEPHSSIPPPTHEDSRVIASDCEKLGEIALLSSYFSPSQEAIKIEDMTPKDKEVDVDQVDVIPWETIDDH